MVFEDTGMRLIPLTREFAAALADGDFSAIRASNLAAVSAPLHEVAKAYVDLYERAPPVAPWIGYLAEDEGAGDIVGSCGYKDRCRDGMVEIAYFSFPGYERRGFASEMARRLTHLALGQPDVQIVRAHTLAEENASVRILRRLQFAHLGTVEDPDDGPVWRWERQRN
jgi:[ribosomal protein S5]-alanine N-acetyltransferase